MTRQHDRRLIAIAFGEHAGFLRGRLRGLGVDQSELDDAVQDVFEVLVRRIAAYDHRRSFRRWMAGVARRIARRHREQSSRRGPSLDGDALVADEGDPERVAARSQARDIVGAFLERLDGDRWAVFVLSEIEGLRGTEIAAELDVNLSTVYARLRSARRAFETAIAEHRHQGAGSWLSVPLLSRWSDAAPSGSLAVVAPVLLGALSVVGLATVLAQGSCGSGPAMDVPRAATERTAVAAAEPGVEQRAVDPAGLAAAELPDKEAVSPEGWVAWGSGGHIRKDGYVGFEGRYRIRGVEIEIEMDWTGDDALPVDAGTAHVELDGFELIDGPESWPIDLDAGATAEVRVKVRAVHEGVVQLALVTRSGDGESWSGSTQRLVLVHGHGDLRKCRDEECKRKPPTPEAGLSGEKITIDLKNDCDRAVEYSLVPDGYDRPADGAQTHSIGAHEQRKIIIDSELWFYRLKPDGGYGGGVRADDGSLVVFYGEKCDSQRATSANLRKSGERPHF